MVATQVEREVSGAHALLNLGREGSSSDSDEGACAPRDRERAAPRKRPNPLVAAPASKRRALGGAAVAPPRPPSAGPDPVDVCPPCDAGGPPLSLDGVAGGYCAVAGDETVAGAFALPKSRYPKCVVGGCDKYAQGRTKLCKGHGGGLRCERDGCGKSAHGATRFCVAHGGGRRCAFAGGCARGAEGRTPFCVAHGGGRRCARPGCIKAAQGATALCRAHGGGRRCSHPSGCARSAVSRFLCTAHGGGRRCAHDGCAKGAQGGTGLCRAHGGGRRCAVDGCAKGVVSRGLCRAHGGGRRCAVDGCERGCGAKAAFCKAHAEGGAAEGAAADEDTDDATSVGGADGMASPTPSLSSESRPFDDEGDAIPEGYASSSSSGGRASPG